MKKLILITLLSTIATAPTFAASGDTSVGSVVFSGFVPGFVSNGDIIITGAGGNTDLTAYTGSLLINADGTFSSSPIVLETHSYTSDTVGDLTEANWTVSQVMIAPATMSEVQPNIVVGDRISTKELTATEYLASEQLSGSHTIQLYVSNNTPHSNADDIAGSEVSVNVDLVATLP
ncbi:hypothetical protein [Vibrio sp. 1CM8B]|uniref:hypothetical protein n=1 Tax=Vibrio sp. 1CM8B TaxID=2929167 RepID=UPI0020C1884B|nr:hypothetical protein [Vibrio sp. 1CM8B]MCK8083998.1 hypothetical protein [Vibrio sp. 1CM8B]